MKRLKMLIVFLLAYFMAVFPAMSALTVDTWTSISLGNKRMKIAQVDFDDSYAYGGEAFDYTAYGFVSVDSIKFVPQDGYIFKYDHTNKKVKVYANAPPIVYEEKHYIPAATTFTVTLNYPAAYIMNVCSATANYAMLSADSTVGTGEILVELYETTPGVRALLTANLNQATEYIYVTYVTQAWAEVFDNLVIDEAYNLKTSAAVALTYTAAAIMYIDNGTHTNIKPIYSSDTAASGEAVVDWTASSSTTKLTGQAAAATSKVSYIKLPTYGFLYDRWVEEEASTMASGAGYATWPVLLWGTAGYMPDRSTTEQAPAVLMLAGDGLGTSNEAYVDWFRTVTKLGNQFASNGTTSTTRCSTYIKGNAWEIPGIVPLEVVNATDLSDIDNVRVEIIGW